MAYEPISVIANEFGLTPVALYRHMKAFPKLANKRHSNYVAAFDQIIEQGMQVLSDLEWTPKMLADALASRAKVAGDWVDVQKIIDDRFKGKSIEEIRHYADTGRWPDADDVAVEVEGSEAVQ